MWAFGRVESVAGREALRDRYISVTSSSDYDGDAPKVCEKKEGGEFSVDYPDLNIQESDGCWLIANPRASSARRHW